MKKKTIGLIDGRSGNIGSIKKAIKDIIKNQPFRLKVIEGDFNIDDFEKIILPGQGAYATLMKYLKDYKILISLKLDVGILPTPPKKNDSPDRDDSKEKIYDLLIRSKT